MNGDAVLASDPMQNGAVLAAEAQPRSPGAERLGDSGPLRVTPAPAINAGAFSQPLLPSLLNGSLVRAVHPSGFW